jgi:hypothetical protein
MALTLLLTEDSKDSQLHSTNIHPAHTIGPNCAPACSTGNKTYYTFRTL